MAESHVISALVAKHADLQGRIKSYQEAIKEARDEISTISKSIKIFDPNYDLRNIAAKKTKERHFKHKELTKLVIEYIKSNDIVDINELTEYVMKAKALPQELHKSIYGGIYTGEFSPSRHNRMLYCKRRKTISYKSPKCLIFRLFYDCLANNRRIRLKFRCLSTF